MKAPLLQLLPLSREGLFWFAISFAMLITGLFKGINLITLLASWMVTLVLLNYCWAYPQLRSAEAKRFFPEAAFASTPLTVLLQITNAGKKAVHGITVHDAGPDHGGARFIPS